MASVGWGWGGEKGGTEKGGMGEVAWLRGEEKDGTEECYHGDGRTNEQVNIYILFFNVFCTILYLYLC